MPVDPERARARAQAFDLALPGARDVPHCHRVAFRTAWKIFATLDAAVPDMNLMFFNADLRDFFCAQAPASFAAVDEAALSSALAAAHARALPKRRPRRAPVTPYRARC